MVSYYGNWGKYNRTALIRVKPNKNGQNTHFEFHAPSSLANPYLVSASIVCACIGGINNKIMAPFETTIDINMTHVDAKKEYYSYKLPNVLKMTLDELENEKYLNDNLGKYFVKCYIATKRLEINEMVKFIENKVKPLCYSLLSIIMIMIN